jgi:AraC-like DNA-binding protein
MIARPEVLTQRPEADPMDLIADILAGLRLTGGIFLDARLGAPFCVTSHLGPMEIAPFLEQAGLVIGYHAVLSGRVRVEVPGEAALTAGPGDVVLVPQGDAHTLASAPGLSPVEAQDLIRPDPEGGLLKIDLDGGGEAAHVFCGFLAARHDAAKVVAALPRLLVVNIADVAARDWIAASVRFAARELAAGRPPGADTASRLSEALLVEALRRYADTAPAVAQRGWLAAARDAHIGRAVALIHADLSAPHRVESLAAAAALSRSAFVARFRALVGQPPAQYLTQARIAAARRRLAETGETLAVIAWDLGYGSEEAFSRAFRRETGQSPSQWRQARAAAQAYAA